MRTRLAALVAVVALPLAACGPTPPGTPAPTATAPGSTGSTAGTTATATPTPSQSTTPTPLTTLELHRPGALSHHWTELFTLPYGDRADQVGTSPGGDGDGMRFGPDYGTQTPDATWWILDTAHRRLAHVSDGGAYLGEVKIPPKYLHQGQYVQWQSPTALVDGRIVLLSTTIDQPGLLLVTPGTASFRRVSLARFVAVEITDGHALYGFDDTGASVRVDPDTGTIRRVSAFAGLDGKPLVVAVKGGAVSIRHGSGSTHTYPVTAAGYPHDVLHPHVEAVVDPSGVTTMLVTGIVERTSGNLLFARLAIFDADGVLIQAEDTRTTESETDPGSGHHLGIRICDTQPWLMFVDPTGLSIFRRA